MNIGLAGAKALPLVLWLPREIGRTWAQEINFINETQREGAGGTGTGLLPPGVSHINNLGTGKGGREGKRSLLRRICLRATDPSPRSLEISPCFFCFKSFRGCPRLQDNSQVGSILLDRPGDLAWLC